MFTHVGFYCVLSSRVTNCNVRKGPPVLPKNLLKQYPGLDISDRFFFNFIILLNFSVRSLGLLGSGIGFSENLGRGSPQTGPFQVRVVSV